jgi:hypothetical protein
LSVTDLEGESVLATDFWLAAAALGRQRARIRPRFADLSDSAEDRTSAY